jgi:hypothetical protein
MNKLVNKLSRRFLVFFSILTVFLVSQITLFAQNILTSNNMKVGSAVFVLKSPKKFFSGRKNPPTVSAAKISKELKTNRANSPLKKKADPTPVAEIEPIAPEDWINEQADSAIEERKVSDSEPFLSLSEGFLNSRAYFCESPQFPEAVRKTKQQLVKSKVLVTVGQYGGILHASTIEGDANFRASVYKTLGSMNFRQSYFMGKPIRIEGLLYFTQNSKNTVLCRETSQELEVPAVIDGGILTEVTKTCQTPEFPADAKTAGLNKVEAKIQVIIDEQGKVIQADAISGHKSFSEAAVNSALKTTFPRSLIAGKPVKVSGLLVFNQTLNNDIRCASEKAN